jgi:hypothetical protein
LEGRAQERHDRLDQLSSERNWYRDQYEALVEALQTNNEWLEYRIEAMRDELLEHGARAAGRRLRRREGEDGAPGAR